MSLPEPRLDTRPGPAAADPLAPRVADLRQFADDPSAILALNTHTQTFRTPGIRGFLAYRRTGRWLIQIGGAYAAEADRMALITAFRGFAARQSCQVLAVQLQRRDAMEHALCGYTVNQLGASYALSVASFGLRGKRFMQLRNKISRARRAGVQVADTTFAELSPADRRRLVDLDDEWLRGKGRHAKPLRFMVGEVGGPAQSLRRLMIARLEGRIVGYVSLSPVWGSRPGWLHDLSRRGADAPPGVMEVLVLSGIEACAAEATPWWHFGFTPFTGLDPSSELFGASRPVQHLIRLLADHGERLYPAASQLDYKTKWGDLLRTPDYLAFSGRPRLSGIVRLARVANVI